MCVMYALCVYVSLCSTYMYIIYRIKVTKVTYAPNHCYYCVLGVTFKGYTTLQKLHSKLHNP